MSVSLMSTGTPSHFVHAAEWVHGDLGCATGADVVVCLSHSGNTAELVHAMGHIGRRNPAPPILSIVGAADESGTPRGSQLQELSAATLSYPFSSPHPEPLGGVPTSSVVAQEMMVNAVVCELITRRGFELPDFAFNHPGGSLGAKLTK
jgi:arabinose-5-phosphate isomerase|eukprot:COSAG01_NODE_3101_length_6580_cov_5.965592_2_plen_149_part_00